MPYVRRFIVEGSGEFPLDMLRFDEAWPLSGDDAAKMSPSYFQDRRADLQRRRIEIATASKAAPSLKRWESFGWRVLDEDGE